MLGAMLAISAHSVVTGSHMTPLRDHTVRVSVNSAGAQGNGPSRDPSISHDGRVVAFESFASNLVESDGNSASDIFVRDLAEGRTVRVSAALDGGDGDGNSHAASVSANGRFVAFSSTAANLVSNDFNAAPDIFLRDLQSDATELVSVGTDGISLPGWSSQPSVSADGRFVTFVYVTVSTGTGILLRDRASGSTLTVAPGGVGSTLAEPAVSGDGMFVAFSSTGALGGGPSDPGGPGVGLWNAQTGVVRISRIPFGTYAHEPSISLDGRYVAYMSNSDVLTVGDSNSAEDIFVFDRIYGSTGRVSIASGGTPTNGVYCRSPSISADGRLVCFISDSTDLVSNDLNGAVTDAFLHNRDGVHTSVRSVSTLGVQSNGSSDIAALSGCGTTVAFSSEADSLVAGDTNGVADVFVNRIRVPEANSAVSRR